MQKIIISDTSCLVLLEKIGELAILHQLYGQVTITAEIEKEYGQPLPEWIAVLNPQNESYQKLLQATLDKGEASAIALAVEIKDCLLVLDDRKARNVAAELKLTYTGTIGVILDAKHKGYIASVKETMKKIRSTDFRLSQEAEQKILKLAGE